MEKQFEILKTNRLLILQIVGNLRLDQLNKIPEGFSNNIAWNMAHLLVTQQLLAYGLSGIEFLISKEIIDNYRKGTTPENPMIQEELDFIKSNYIKLVDHFKEDYNKGIFKEFKTYPTSTGIVLNSIEDVIKFNNFHEGIHLGIILSLKKLV